MSQVYCIHVGYNTHVCASINNSIRLSTIPKSNFSLFGKVCGGGGGGINSITLLFGRPMCGWWCEGSVPHLLRPLPPISSIIKFLVSWTSRGKNWVEANCQGEQSGPEGSRLLHNFFPFSISSSFFPLSFFSLLFSRFFILFLMFFPSLARCKKMN